jgi:hypothetical protein
MLVISTDFDETYNVTEYGEFSIPAESANTLISGIGGSVSGAEAGAGGNDNSDYSTYDIYGDGSQEAATSSQSGYGDPNNTSAARSGGEHSYGSSDSTDAVYWAGYSTGYAPYEASTSPRYGLSDPHAQGGQFVVSTESVNQRTGSVMAPLAHERAASSLGTVQSEPPAALGDGTEITYADGAAITTISTDVAGSGAVAPPSGALSGATRAPRPSVRKVPSGRFTNLLDDGDGAVSDDLTTPADNEDPLKTRLQPTLSNIGELDEALGSPTSYRPYFSSYAGDVTGAVHVAIERYGQVAFGCSDLQQESEGKVVV